MTKRIFALLLAALLILPQISFGWNKFTHEVIAEYATAHLRPKVKKQVVALLDGQMREHAAWLNTLRKEEDTKHTAAWHNITLDANNKPVRGENDLLTQLERCENILRNRNEYKSAEVAEALKIYIHLVSDMHNPSHVIFTDIPRSRGFKFKTTNNRTDSYAHRGKTLWRNLWNNIYPRRHSGFTVEWAAHDLSIYARGHEQEWAQGTAATWAEELGAYYRPLYDIFDEERVIGPEIVNRMENTFDRGKAQAALRLAAMLNSIFAQ